MRRRDLRAFWVVVVIVAAAFVAFALLLAERANVVRPSPWSTTTTTR